MKNVEINILDLCDAFGGIHNVVDILQQISGSFYIIWSFKKPLDEEFTKKIFKNPVLQKYGHDSIVIKIVEDPPHFRSSEIELREFNDDENITIIFLNVDDDFKGDIKKFIYKLLGKLGKKKEKIKMKYKSIDPYDEENWNDEIYREMSESKKYFKTNKILEALNQPYEEDSVMTYSQYYGNNLNSFRQDLITDLKNKLVGKIIYIVGKRCYDWRDKKIDLVDTLTTNPVYKIKVKDVNYNGTHRSEIHYVDIIDSENKRYFLKRIVDEKTYNRFYKKFETELKRIEEEKNRKERIRLKHLYHDPFSEEKWDEDD